MVMKRNLLFCKPGRLIAIPTMSPWATASLCSNPKFPKCSGCIRRPTLIRHFNAPIKPPHPSSDRRRPFKDYRTYRKQSLTPWPIRHRNAELKKHELLSAYYELCPWRRLKPILAVLFIHSSQRRWVVRWPHSLRMYVRLCYVLTPPSKVSFKPTYHVRLRCGGFGKFWILLSITAY